MKIGGFMQLFCQNYTSQVYISIQKIQFNLLFKTCMTCALSKSFSNVTFSLNMSQVVYFYVKVHCFSGDKNFYLVTAIVQIVQCTFR